jgi:hypothetical protein
MTSLVSCRIRDRLGGGARFSGQRLFDLLKFPTLGGKLVSEGERPGLVRER